MSGTRAVWLWPCWHRRAEEFDNSFQYVSVVPCYVHQWFRDNFVIRWISYSANWNTFIFKFQPIVILLFCSHFFDGSNFLEMLLFPNEDWWKVNAEFFSALSNLERVKVFSTSLNICCFFYWNNGRVFFVTSFLMNS